MNLVLTTEQAEELRGLLEVSRRELAHEIAATDNAAFRAELIARRGRLAAIDDELRGLLLVPATFDDGGEALIRELARPGD